EPTSPFVSGGAQLQLTPGNTIPSKFRIGAGMWPRPIVRWTTGSFTFRLSPATSGFGLISCSTWSRYGIGGSVRSGAVSPCATDWPMIGLDDVLTATAGVLGTTL